MAESTVPSHLTKNPNLSVVPKPRLGKRIRVFLIITYKILQESFKILLENKDDMIVVGVLEETETLPEHILNQSDVVLIYLLDDDAKTVELIPQLLAINPLLRIIVAAGGSDFENQMRAIQLGAVGMVKKEENSRFLIEAIRQTYRGETCINQVLLNKLLNHNNSNQNYDGKGNGSNHYSFGNESITKREKEVIAMIGEGLKNKEIAKQMFISEATVRHHLSSIYGKLGVDDRLNLVIYAYQQGLLKFPS